MTKVSLDIMSESLGASERTTLLNHHKLAMARVSVLLHAAQNLLSEPKDLFEKVRESTGLSKEGVHLGFSKYFEAFATEQDLSKLCFSIEAAQQVTLILSANVFIAPLRAMAIALASSSRVTVRPSSREPWVATYLVDELLKLKTPRSCFYVSLVDEINVPDISCGDLHVYGTDKTISSIQTQLKPNVRLMSHPSGMGIALVSEHDSLKRAAFMLARDMIPFDQRGCLSPKITFFLGRPSKAKYFASCLHEGLQCYEKKIPRGQFFEEETEEKRRFVDTWTFAGDLWEDLGSTHAVALGPPGAPLFLPPAGRNMYIACIEDEAILRVHLSSLKPHITCIGALHVEKFIPLLDDLGFKARRSQLGNMQNPPFDGPVDRRTSL